MNSLFHSYAILGSHNAPNYEPEADAFFAKGVALGESSLSTPFKEAINDAYKYIKDNIAFSKFKVLRWYVGGTPVWHSINGAGPDTYQSTFGGSPTHNADGITFSGIGQWCDHNFARNLLASDNFSFGFWSNTAGVTGYDIGIEDTSGANKSVWMASRLSGDRFQTSYGTDVHDTTGVTDAVGFWSFSASDAGSGNTLLHKFKDGVSLRNTTIATSNISLSTLNIFSGALNSNGSANYYSNRNIQFEFIAEALTTVEMASLYTAISTLQTAIR